MSANQNKLLVRRFIEEVINTGSVEHMDDFISSDYVEVYQGQRHALGVAGMTEHIRGVRQTYPDLLLTVESQIAEGEWVATQYTARGTHRGLWLGIQPTGKLITITGVNIDRVVDGKIVEHGGAANLLEPLLAIGAIQMNTSPAG